MTVVTNLMSREASTDKPAYDLKRAFDAHYALVYRLAYRVTGSGVDAQDIAQEAFLRLYDRQLPLEQESDVRAWLCRVTVNLAYNSERGRRRRERRENRASGDASMQAGVSEDPASALARQSDVEGVRRALVSLPDRQRQILLLRYAGLSYREVAQATGVAPSSVGTLLARAEAAFEATYRSQQRKPEWEDEHGTTG